MSIRLKIEVCKKEGIEHYGSIGATCGLELEIDQSVLADPAAAGNGPAVAAAEAPPPKRPAARSPATPPPAAKRAAAVAEAEDPGDAIEPEEEGDPPTDGRRLLGWARNQPEDAKNWLVGFGKRSRYPGRILDWTPQQVETAYQTYRAAQRS
jgi:hypothetical protein